MTSATEAVEHFLIELVEALGVSDLSPTLTPDPARAAEIVDALADVAGAPDRAIDWLVINERRVDATVLASGREWRLACSIDREGVHSASSFERPQRFEGTPGGRAVVVLGPSSAGKSTVMRAVIDAAPTPWVMFDEASFGTVAWPFLIWPEESPTLRAGFIAGMAALATAGNQVILSGAVGSKALRPLTATVPTAVVGLECPLSVRIARQHARSDRWGGLTESSESAYEGWTLDARYDTSIQPADVIARMILKLVDAVPLRTA